MAYLWRLLGPIHIERLSEDYKRLVSAEYAMIGGKLDRLAFEHFTHNLQLFEWGKRRKEYHIIASYRAHIKHSDSPDIITLSAFTDSSDVRIYEYDKADAETQALFLRVLSEQGLTPADCISASIRGNEGKLRLPKEVLEKRIRALITNVAAHTH